jgi:proline dehydrogenase
VTNSSSTSTTNQVTVRESSRAGRGLLLPIALAASALLLLRNGEQWLRAVLLHLSSAGWARRMVTGFGPAWAMAGRFVAGESVDEAMATAHQINGEGMTVALDYLGESVTMATEAVDARDQILLLIDRMQAEKVDAYVSVKLSQLGLKLGENLALQNLRMILERARAANVRVRIDMEESALVDMTLDIYRRLRMGEGFDNVGVVIQSALYRSEEDVKQLVREGAWVRLVKGAYLEPETVAYPDKRDVDAAFVRLMQMLLREDVLAQGVLPAVATHDEAMIQKTMDLARNHAIAPERFEFQMLYGIRRERQRELAAQGWRVRVYVPYGTAWYPYFMRRLAERPANLWFFASSFFKK